MDTKGYSLGIEFSTQSVKIAVLDLNQQQVIYTNKFNFDTAFPQYKTSCGHTSPFMLIESLDCVFKKLQCDIDLSLVSALKIDAMQHCTVYTNKNLETSLKKLHPSSNLLKQLKNSISRNTSPTWEDRSTAQQAKTLSDLFHKSGKDIVKLTGNRIELRFPAVQIMKWAKECPQKYSSTKNIFILSAFLTSILCGKISPVDTGDGWGSNLNSIDINKPSWDKQVLKIIDGYFRKLGINGSLKQKLGEISHYDQPAGFISNYFVTKYGINPKTAVLTGTGDNPATLLGCGGQTVISLGSSYTVNGVMSKIITPGKGEYNIFGYTKGNAMALSCITNGGKLHDYFLRKFVARGNKEIGKNEWAKYIASAGNSALKTNEKLMLPYLMDESVPLSKKGILRDGFNENDAQANIRSLHVSQALSLKVHSGHLSKVEKICVVGGGSKNLLLRQLISDIFNAESYTIKNSDFAAPVGCAVSGARFVLGITYKEACDRFVQKDESNSIKPAGINRVKTAELIKRYSILEKNHIGGQ